MLLRAVQRPTRCIAGYLAPRTRVSSAPLLRLQTAGRPASDYGHGHRMFPAKKPLPYWSIAFAGIFMGTLAGGYERFSKLAKSLLSVLEAMPARPPEMEPSRIINAMIDLKEGSNSAEEFLRVATLYERYKPDLRLQDPISVCFYLTFYMTLLRATLVPTQNIMTSYQELVLQEVPFIFPVSWDPLRKAVLVARDPIALGLLLQVENEIQAIRASACTDIFNLLHSDEVKTGRMKPIDVVKAMIEPLQKARFNALSNIFKPVYERLVVVKEERAARAERAMGPSEENREQGHTVLG